MALKKLIEGPKKLTESRDSGWQEWFKQRVYYFDNESQKVVVKLWEFFENTRRPYKNYKRLVSSKQISVNRAPKKVQKNLKKRGYLSLTSNSN